MTQPQKSHTITSAVIYWPDSLALIYCKKRLQKDVNKKAKIITATLRSTLSLPKSTLETYSLKMPQIVLPWWLRRICLPMQETRIRSLNQEDVTCFGACPQLLSLRSKAREPQRLSPHAATMEAPAPQSPCFATREATATLIHHDQRVAPAPTAREKPRQQQNLAEPKT